MHPTQPTTQDGDSQTFGSSPKPAKSGDDQPHFNTIIEPRYSPTFRDCFNINSTVRGAIFRPTFSPVFEKCFNLNFSVEADESYHESSRNRHDDPDRGYDIVLHRSKEQAKQDAIKGQTPLGDKLINADPSTTTSNSFDGSEANALRLEG